MTRLPPQLIAVVRQALDWWLSELAGMIPEQVKRILKPARSHIILALRSDGLAVLYSASGETKDIAFLPVGDTWSPESLTAAIPEPRIRRQILRDSLPVALHVSARKALLVRMTLPAAIKTDLARVLQFEMDRRTPFSVENAYFTHRVLPGSPDGKLNILMTVVAKATVTEALDAIASLKLKPRCVMVEATDGQPASGNLLPGAERDTDRLRLPLRIAAATGVLMLVAGLYTVWRDSEHAVAVLRRDMASLRQTVEQVETARKEIERLKTASAFLAERRRTSVPVTAMLAELTRVMPDDTWLTQLSMTDDKLQLSGYSAAAASLIRQVTQSPAFRAPQFRSAVTQDAAVGRERFELVVSVAGESRL